MESSAVFYELWDLLSSVRSLSEALEEALRWIMKRPKRTLLLDKSFALLQQGDARRAINLSSNEKRHYNVRSGVRDFLQQKSSG